MTGGGFVIGLAFLLGAATQRLTGLGFAIVAAPFVIIAVGAWNAVGLINAVGLVLGTGLLFRMRRDIDWRRVASIGASASIAVVPGTALASAGAGSPALDVAIGALLLVSIVLVRRGAAVRHDGVGSRISTGLVSGAMNAVAGLAGPALVVYGRTSGWQTRSFVASLQPILVAMSVTTLVARSWLGSTPALPAIGLSTWGFIACTSVTGFAIGEWLSARLKMECIEKSIVLAASLAAVIAVVKGVAAYV